MTGEWRGLVEERLGQVLPAEGGRPAELLAAMRYAVFPGGKRLRPLLVMAAADLGGRATEALDAACAVELVHSYSLVHDDLPCMDDDDMRRGRPSCHRVFGQAVALLAGNALLSLAFEVLGSYRGDLGRLLVVELARACGSLGLAGGQAGDLLWEPGEDSYFFVADAKTGALFRACLRMGGLVAGLDAGAMALLDRCGLELGRAFQIRDDLADAPGGGEERGMSALAVWGERGARERAREQVRALAGTIRELGAEGTAFAHVVSLAVGGVQGDV